MTAKIVTEYLSKRAKGERRLPAPRLKFTLAQLKALPSADFDYEVRDTERKGLICRVRKSGVKTLEIYKKPKGSHKPVRVTICQLNALPWKDSNPNTVSVESEVYRVLAELRAGHNPTVLARLEKQAKAATEVKLKEAAAEYLNAVRIKESTRSGYKSIIENHFPDDQETALVDLLKRPELESHHQRITNKSGPVAANNAMRVLRAICNYIREDAEETLSSSPVPPWPIKGRNTTKRFWNKESRRTGWIKPEYIKDWWEATERLPNGYAGDGETARDYLQFILLSGLRRREATQLNWSDIDFKSKSFKIRDTKNNQVLELPCSDQMLKILKRRHALGNEGPFKIEEPKKFVAWVRKESGVHFTVHDLRRSFITYAETLDFGRYTIKALVNHSTGNPRDVTEGYLQLSVERLRKPMNQIATYIACRVQEQVVSAMSKSGD